MKNGTRHLFFISISLFTVLSFLVSGLVSGCGAPMPKPEPPAQQPEQPSTQKPVTSAPSAPSQPMVTQLSFSDYPILGEPVQLTFTFNLNKGYKWDAPGTTAQIGLSDGFELLEGDLKWQGDVKPGEVHKITVTVKAVERGIWHIEGRGFWLPGGNNVSGGSSNLYVFVKTNESIVSDTLLSWGGTAYGHSVNPPIDEQVIIVELSSPNPPALGQTGEVICTAKAVRDARGVQLGFNLREGLELVNGDNRWNGDMSKDTQVEIKATIRAVKTGRCQIAAWASYNPSGTENVYHDYLDIYVLEDWAKASRVPAYRIAKIAVGLNITTGALALNQTAELTCTATALNEDMTTSRVSIGLPMGFELVSGNLSWEGTLKKDVPIQLNATIKAIKTGGWNIVADAGSRKEGTLVINSRDSLNISVY